MSALPRIRRRRRLAGALGLALIAVVGTSCNKWGYEAKIEWLNVNSSSITLGGTVVDTIRSGRPGACFDIVVQVDGTEKDRGGLCQIFPVPEFNGSSTGFSFEILDTGGGGHDVCVDIVPRGEQPTAAADCRKVSLIWDQHDNSRVDTVSIDGTTVSASGWYSKITFSKLSESWEPGWTLNGTPIPAGSIISESVIERPDVTPSQPTGKGYNITATLPTGTQQRLCLDLLYDHRLVMKSGECKLIDVG